MSETRTVTSQLNPETFISQARLLGFRVTEQGNIIKIFRTGMYAEASLNRQTGELHYDHHMDKIRIGELVAATYSKQMQDIAECNGYDTEVINNKKELLIKIKV